MLRVLCIAAVLGSASALLTEKEPPIMEARRAVEGQPVRQRLKSDDGMAYYGVINVGGQPQISIYDTGSFDIVLESMCLEGEEANFAKNASEATCCTKKQCPHAGYNVKSSGGNYHASKASSKLTQIVYGSGPVLVRAGTDHVSIKDSLTAVGTKSEVAAKDMLVQVIVDHKVELFKQTTMQAIVGIGPGAYKDRATRMVHNLGVKRFMLCFQQDAKADGFMTWNDKDRTRDAEWLEVPVSGVMFWAVKTSDFKLSEASGTFGKIMPTEKSVGCNPSCGGIIDSGTSLITPPPEVVKAIQKTLEAGKVTDCSDLSKFPTFDFKLGDKQFSLPPASYIADAGVTEVFLKHQFLAFNPIPMTAKDAEFVQAAVKRGDQSVMAHSCVLLLSPNTEPQPTQWGPMVIFGMSLFRKYAVQFDLAGDMENREHSAEKPTRFMRFAETKPDCSGTAKGSRYRMQDGEHLMQKVSLNKLRISPLQQRMLPARSSGEEMRLKPVLVL